VVVFGAMWDEAHAQAIEEAREGGVLIHPFDHPDIWTGHATLVHEVAQTLERPGSVVVSVGGGGLLVGVLQGLQDVGWGDVEVLAVETHGAASLAKAMALGRPAALPKIDSVAITLGAKQVADRALALALARPVTPVQVTDTAAVEAAERFADDHRVLVEPACGAALSLLYARHERLTGPVLTIVCGGASASRAAFETWRRDARD